jgi:hypothetical protein
VRNPNLFLNYPTTASDGMQMNRKGRFAQDRSRSVGAGVLSYQRIRNFLAVKLGGCNLSVCNYLKEFAQIAAMKHLNESGSKNEIQDVPF